MEVERNMTPPIENTHIVIGAQSNDHSAHLSGISSKRFFTDAHTFARVQLLVSEYYRLDVPINFWDVYNVEAESLGQKVVYPYSCSCGGMSYLWPTSNLRGFKRRSYRNSEKRALFWIHAAKRRISRGLTICRSTSLSKAKSLIKRLRPNLSNACLNQAGWS